MRFGLADIILAIFGTAVVFAAASFIVPARADPPVTLVQISKPEELPAAVTSCKNNCLIRLQPGVYGTYDYRNLNPQPGKITIDFTNSSFVMMRFAQSSNLTIVGGEVVAGNQWGQCWVIDGDTGMVLTHNTALRCTAASFIITRSRDIMLLGWTSLDAFCDGVTVSGTDGYTVANGLYSGYYPNPNGCHADGIQMWGMDGFPLAHGLVMNNEIHSTGVLLVDGKSMGIQGITAFANNAPGGAGYPQDSITVTGNRMYLNGSWCVAIFKTTNLTAKDNRCVNEVPRPWNSNYGWNGSTGAIGPNYLDNVPQTYTPASAAAKPPASKRARRAKLKAAIIAAVLPPIFIAASTQRAETAP